MARAGEPDAVHTGRCAVLVSIIFALQWPLLQGALKRRDPADVYYATDVADRFASYASAHNRLIDRLHRAEQGRLQEAIVAAVSGSDKALLEGAATTNEESRLEGQNAINEMVTFSETLKEAMGGQGFTGSCRYLACGEHASCAVSRASGAAHCVCNEGYQGNGFVCNPPLVFVEHPLLDVAPSSSPPEIADVYVATLRGQGVAVVFRDVSKRNRGFVMLGTVGPMRMRWASAVPFSNQSEAYSPVLVELQDGSGVAIAFRDRNRGGAGILIGGRRDPSTDALRLGPARSFARHQAQGVAVLPMRGSHVAVLYSEHVFSGSAGKLPGGAMYGSAIVARFDPEGSAVQVVGKTRFVSGPVARLSAALLSPTAFVVAYRMAADADDSGGLREASCLVGQIHGADLVFNPHPLSLEPEQPQIWARGVAPVQDHIFAYVYHSGAEQATKQALVRIDPDSHVPTVVQGPTVIGEGFTPYVGTVSAAPPFPEQRSADQLRLLQGRSPRTFTYFGGGSRAGAQGQVCGADAGAARSCKDVAWSGHEVISASAAPTGDGRILLVFTDARGAPYYQFVGLD